MLTECGQGSRSAIVRAMGLRRGQRSWTNGMSVQAQNVTTSLCVSGNWGLRNRIMLNGFRRFTFQRIRQMTQFCSVQLARVWSLKMNITLIPHQLVLYAAHIGITTRRCAACVRIGKCLQTHNKHTQVRHVPPSFIVSQAPLSHPSPRQRQRHLSVAAAPPPPREAYREQPVILPKESWTHPLTPSQTDVVAQVERFRMRLASAC